MQTFTWKNLRPDRLILTVILLYDPMCLSKFIELPSKNSLSDKWLPQVREIVTETGGKISLCDRINALFFVVSGIYNKAKKSLGQTPMF